MRIARAAGKYPHLYDRCPLCEEMKCKCSKQCAACTMKLLRLMLQPDDPSIRHIPLTKGYFAVVDASDYERCMQIRWSAKVDRRVDGSLLNVYAVGHIPNEGKYKTVYLHRFILGVTDPKLDVDHWDNDGLNCRRTNLRVATRTQNKQNQRKTLRNKSGYKGVSWDKSHDKYRVVICVNGKQRYLGMRVSPVEAAKLYDTAALELFGEFANLNFERGVQVCE